MELVVDTNILFSCFWKESFTRKVILCQGVRLYSPEFSLSEIQKYKQDIMKKAAIYEKEFQAVLEDIAVSVHFFPIEEYAPFLRNALDIAPDPNDIDFFALCLKLDLPLWSNDVILKKQNNVAVFSTQDLFDQFFRVLFPDV